ncbi:MAG TPA: sigma-70 family RNA polymerase sigma factor [Blastocatellia bacterium]|nr:sigma-70 family RNA polymerase sigma factor [Blastocatellia bacterium]
MAAFSTGARLATEITHASELELVSRAREGDEAAFEEIVRRYSPRVFQIASRFFRNRSIVEEIAQEVFLKAFRELRSFEGRGSFEGWLSRIATNRCLNELRSAKRRPESPVADLTDEQVDWLDNHLSDISAARHQASVESAVAADLAEKVLGTLSPDDRLVLTLLDGEELSVKEIAAMTGWSESKVKVQAFRARRRMRKAVEELLKSRSQGERRKTKT